jgi:hypothetical protein
VNRPESCAAAAVSLDFHDAFRTSGGLARETGRTSKTHGVRAMKTPLRLPAGCRVTLRSIGPADAGALQDFVQHRLGAASRRCRFHGAVNGCAPALLRQLTGADGAQHVAWAAWL